jgi:hypothetical protein
MVIIHTILVIIFLFGSGFAQSDTAESSKSLQAEATVQIQYDGEVGSGIILMTSYPVSCTSSVTSITSSQGTMPILTSLATNTPFNTPLVFGTSRTQMINATSTSQYLSQTASSASQIMTGATATQTLPESSTSIPQASPVAGSGTRLHDVWSHVFFWAAIAEIMSGYL